MAGLFSTDRGWHESMDAWSLIFCDVYITVLFSLGAKCPSAVVRDNLKVFFSRYQNRHRELLLALCPPTDTSGDAMSTDDDSNAPQPPRISPARQMALTRCDISELFVKVLMDLFVPHVTRYTLSTQREPIFRVDQQKPYILSVLLHSTLQCGVPRLEPCTSALSET